jgi:hypothetical protein
MPRFYGRKDAADYLSNQGLKTSPRTLEKLAVKGGGPDYRIYGVRAVYTAEDLDRYADNRLTAPRKSTSA